jgi:hypothetical protein
MVFRDTAPKWWAGGAQVVVLRFSRPDLARPSLEAPPNSEQGSGKGGRVGSAVDKSARDRFAGDVGDEQSE